MRDLLILLVQLIATLARLLGPGGLRSVVAESLLVKQQLLILNRPRHRALNLRASDRIVAGVCALFMRPARVLRSGRWCTNRNWPATVPTTGASPTDGVRSWAAHIGHRIQQVAP